MFHGILSQWGLNIEDYENLIKEGAGTALSDLDFLTLELNKWLKSKKRREMLDGKEYYTYEAEPFKREKLWGADADGCPTYIKEEYQSNIDNQYAKLVDQKVNYLLGKPFSLQTDNKEYTEWLKQIFDKSFQRTLQAVTMLAINQGVSWLHPYYNESGELVFKLLPAHEVLPFWKDREHITLDIALHWFVTMAYEGRQERIVQHVDVYSKDRVEHYILENGVLVEDVERPTSVLTWGVVPLVPFKYNPLEIPLIRRIKHLQDNLNIMRANWDKNMSESVMDNILILRNYGGENLSEFRQNLMRHGAVKVRDDGGVEVLRLDRDSNSYIQYLKDTKAAIIENGRGFDAKDDRMSSNPNEMNLRSMYSDIDLDADMVEQQYQASFDQLLWFVDEYLKQAGAGDFSREEVVFTFDRNIIVNNAEVISDIQSSQGIVSKETLLARHPFVNDVQMELQRLKAEKEEQEKSLANYPFNQVGDDNAS